MVHRIMNDGKRSQSFLIAGQHFLFPNFTRYSLPQVFLFLFYFIYFIFLFDLVWVFIGKKKKTHQPQTAQTSKKHNKI